MAKVIGGELQVLYSELNNWDYDDDDNQYPKAYLLHGAMFGHEFDAYISTNALKSEDGLNWAMVESPSVIHSSLTDMLEDSDHADEFREIFKSCWAEWDEDSIYDYLGNKINS